MDIKPVSAKTDYRAEPEGEHLDALETQVEEYENKHYLLDGMVSGGQ